MTICVNSYLIHCTAAAAAPLFIQTLSHVNVSPWNCCVAKVRYAVKFECNAVCVHMNFKLNLEGSPREKKKTDTDSVLESVFLSHVLLIYFGISL